MPTIRVQHDDFDLTTEVNALRAANPGIGAVASFVGLVRNRNERAPVETLTLEHYPAMTAKALARIVDEAMRRWKVVDATVIHRVGTLKSLDQIVLVAVASAHRGDAFAACEFIMDYLKTSAPFWKKEATPEGSRWVEARASDDVSAGRWRTESTPT
jgi:molybdopterin synthase catalytic subunit